jgi:membrane dipeptidase
MRTSKILAAGLALGLLASCSIERQPVPESWRPQKAAPAPAPAPEPSDPLDVARALAKSAILVDGHVDLPFRLWAGRDENGEITEDVTKRTEKGDFDFVRAEAGGLNAPFMSIYTPASFEKDGKPVKGGAKKLADALIDIVEKVVASAPGKAAIARSPAEIEANHKNGVLSLPLGMENGSPIEGDLKNLDHFYARGIRYITLAHSKDNHIADSSYDQRYTNGGLSDFGKKVVQRMNALGIFVDVSHLSDDAAKQAIALSEAPVIASHSSCRKFTPGWERNISDELIQQVAAKGGVVMINFGSTFLMKEARAQSDKLKAELDAQMKEKGIEYGSDEHIALRKAFYADKKVARADVAKVVEHIQHAVSLVGVDHVGLGSDFDGVGDTLPDGLRDVSQYPNLLKALLDAGHDEAAVAKIAGGNALRAWRQVEATAKRLSAEKAQ